MFGRAKRGAPSFFLVVPFSNTSKSGFSLVKSVLFVDVPSPQLAHGPLYPPPRPPQKMRKSSIWLQSGVGLSDNFSHLSSKMAIGGLAGARPSKKGRHSRAKRRVRKKPSPLSSRMSIFDPADPKKVILLESGEGEGRFAL